jgi:hypothetical protein
LCCEGVVEERGRGIVGMLKLGVGEAKRDWKRKFVRKILRFGE